MAIDILMPALSPTMESGTLSKWTIAVGDPVRSGDVIAEIETDKATMEVEAVDDGVLASILVADGSDGVAVGTVIARLAEDGEAVEEFASAAVPPPAPVSPTPVSDVAEASAASKTVEVSADPVPAVAAPVQTSDVVAVAAPKAPATSVDGSRIFVSPLARRIAAERGIDLARLSGSGPHGRILRRDVEEQAASPAPVMAALASAPVAGASSLEPNSQMRRIIAQRLQESKANAPHFYLTVDCEIDNLLAARRMMNDKAADGVKISINDLVIRAAAMALMAVPKANASWEGDHTRLFHHADIAMAVAVDGGLVTPVVWAAEQKGLAALSEITRDLASRARDGQLAPKEFSGGSFTISNLGMYGIREFAAVINPPHGAILAVGAGEERPVVRDGQLAVATVMTVTLSADHRVVDGAVGAEWLQAFKGYIEQPVTMLL
ncbi:MAG: pyruvate dehydrogenase complex dihydrolipoamide acetyltransferase [Rhodospirillaceae bacterium]|nr:pyruvate dehydrogenase complex dihydrolipoamide acetyltransferase [Rhodospirillaceae bacterium]